MGREAEVKRTRYCVKCQKLHPNINAEELVAHIDELHRLEAIGLVRPEVEILRPGLEEFPAIK